MQELIYTGIGSRETPERILNIMKSLALSLAEDGFILRSGGADGADSAFEAGCDMRNGKKEIYLPWKGFNNRDSQLHTVTSDALRMASLTHPYWDKLSKGGKLLHARNCYQVLGSDLNTKSAFVVGYTAGGKGKGGTGQAFRVARANGIPYYDLGRYECNIDVGINLVLTHADELRS